MTRASQSSDRGLLRAQVVIAGLTLLVLAGQGYLIWRQTDILEQHRNIMSQQTNIMADQTKIADQQRQLQQSMLQIQTDPSIDFWLIHAAVGMNQIDLFIQNRGAYPIEDVMVEKEEVWVSSPPYELLLPKLQSSSPLTRSFVRTFPSLAPNTSETIRINPALLQAMEMARADQQVYAFVCFRLIYHRNFDHARYAKRQGILVFEVGNRLVPVYLDAYLQPQAEAELQRLAEHASRLCRPDTERSR